MNDIKNNDIGITIKALKVITTLIDNIIINTPTKVVIEVIICVKL